MKIFHRFVIFIFIFILALAGLKFYQDYLLSPPDPDKEKEVVFVVHQGESVMEVAKRLEQERLIRSANAFTILARSIGRTIQAGNFQVSPSQSAREILERLQVGVADKKITFMEGWRVEEMAEKLNLEFGIPNTEFIGLAKEGYMFPDTYMFAPDVKVAEISQMMKNNFDKKYGVSLQEKIKKRGLTPAQGVILASIVEREGRSDEVRRMVASILLKRFKIGMALNADATIQYALGYQVREKSWWKRHLSRDDLKFDSPYNTYIHSGLPPTPIANPSLSSLQAIAEADFSTPYLYYYHDSQGRSHYGRTLEEHNDNILKYP